MSHNAHGAGAGLRPEDRALLLAARCARDPAARDTLRCLLEAGIDWESLSENARAHGMQVILAKRLMDCLPESVPPERLNGFRRLYRASTLESIRKVRELLVILERLRQNGIEALPLKGPVLAEAAYGDVGVRVSCDLDLLLARADIKPAADLLAEWGYRPQLRLDSRRWAALLRFGCELALLPGDRQTTLDVHWRIASKMVGCKVDMRRLRLRSRAVKVLGQMVPWPRSDDLFLVLCVHGSRHQWGQLELIYAVAEVVEAHSGLDWMGLLRAAADLGCHRRCLLGGLLAAEVLDAPLPPAFLRQARADPQVVLLAGRAMARLFKSDRSGSLTFREMMDWDIRSLDTHWAQVRYLLIGALAPSPADWEKLTLPTRLHSLYYLARPIRLLIKHGSRVVGSSRRAGA